MNIERGYTVQNMSTMVRMIRVGIDRYDILAFRNRMVLATNVSYVDAMSLCRRKGWIVA
jgi:hypothetical protein